MIDEVLVQASEFVSEGMLVLWQGDAVIWVGPLGAPIEDVECDRVTLNPKDYARIRKLTQSRAARTGSDKNYR